MQERSDEYLYNPIDLNHIFNDDDILDEWIREGEEPILSSDNLNWLDQDLPSREGREAARADDGGTSNRVSRCGSCIAQGRDIGSSRKGKAPQIIVSNTSSDDGDDRVNRGGSNIVGDSENSEDTSGDNGAGGGIGASSVVDSGNVNQVDHDMLWAQGNENYYATQDIDHGYRPGIWEQRKHLEGLTTFPSDDDYSSGHDYRSNCNQIDEHFQSLALGSVPHFKGEGVDPIITLEVVIILQMLLVGMILISIQPLEQELVVPMDMTDLLIVVALVLSPSSLQGHIFLIIDHQPNHLSQHIQVMNNSFNHILTIQIIVLVCMLVVGLMMMMILSSLIIQHGID